MQAVYVYLVAEALKGALLFAACALGARGGVAAGVLLAVSLLVEGGVLACVVPMVADAFRVLAQGTPLEVVAALPHLHSRLAALPGVLGLWFRVYGLGFRVSGFRVLGFGFRIYGLGVLGL